MVTNPGSERNRKIPPELYPELAESIGEWLRTARDVYGAEVAYVSFNEADIGVNVVADVRQSTRRSSPRSARGSPPRGLRTRWLLGDCSNMAGCVSYARPIWESPSARPYLGRVRLPHLGLERLRRGARPGSTTSAARRACRSVRRRAAGTRSALAAARAVPGLDERAAARDRLRRAS